MKILVCGPECSGKTSLSEKIAQHYNIEMLPEHAVSYLERHGSDYSVDDIQKIAAEHFALYESLKSRESSFVMDSFLINLLIWAEYRFDADLVELRTWLEEVEFDLVFLMKPDLVWENAPFRENASDRDHLFDRYIGELNQLNWPYHIIEGKGDERWVSPKTIIDQFLED